MDLFFVEKLTNTLSHCEDSPYCDLILAISEVGESDSNSAGHGWIAIVVRSALLAACVGDKLSGRVVDEDALGLVCLAGAAPTGCGGGIGRGARIGGNV